MRHSSSFDRPGAINERWKQICYASPTGIGVCHLDGRFVSVNPAFCRMTGHHEEELLTMGWHQLAWSPDVSVLQMDVGRLLEGSVTTCASEQRLTDPQGHEHWYGLQMEFMYDASNQPEFLLIHMQDISLYKSMEQRYHSLLYYNPAAMIRINTSCEIEDANPAAEQVSGYTLGEALGRSLDDFVLAKNETIVTIQHKGGHAVNLEVKVVPIMTDERTTGYHVIGRELTSLEQVEESLRSKEQELQEIVTKQQGMTFKCKEIDGRFIHTMCAGELVYRAGHTPEQIIGHELRDFLPAETALRKEQYYRRAWQGEEHVLYEGYAGNGVTYLASLKPIKRNGQVVEVIASCVDISEKKKAEEELRRTKELLESFVQHTSDAIDLVDLEGKVLWVNPAFETVYGWTLEELRDRKLPVFPENTASEEENSLKKITLFGQSATGLGTVRKRKDGRLIDIDLTVSPLRDNDGEIIAYSAISRDITERKKTEELLRKSDKLGVVGQLAAGLAHEIRNPLTALRGFLQVMRSGQGGKSEYYGIMMEELDRINFIVSELLLIAKPEKHNPKQAQVNVILQGVATLLESQALMNNVTIVTQIAEGLPPIVCSPVQIKQVFINLVKNAIESMPDGGEITIRADLVEGNRIVTTVEDQGCGIPAERIPSLGEPFYSTKVKGTGLGLMMCYKIIESHGGQICFYSKLNQGTQVEVVLPLIQ
ncbi:PAS domain S-box protein [Paenibacillus validus]|uniref:histidine kinase n=1 Tax=Paenibacillus validus TaxID=44253 RepID=A0A7X2ZAX8_9BACL|nr:PAS domain S-box protein [Paenibacillus validus]MUG71564.1 PAS domain S-box protein [Paenibacillus validus]